MSKMLPDEILREAARILAQGYPPDALGPIKTWFRVCEGGHYPDHRMYNDMGALRGTYPNKDRAFHSSYEDVKRRSYGNFVVETVEIPIRRIPFKEAVWDVKEAAEEKKKAAAAKRLAKRMATDE